MRNKLRAAEPSLLLDLDDTILDFHSAERVAIAATLRELGIDPTDAVISRYSEINLKFWERLENGLVTRQQVLVGRFEELFRELQCSCSAELAKSIYEQRLAIGHFFMPGAEKMLEELRGSYRLFVCTNGTASVQNGRIASAGIAPLFEDIFISEEIGFNKPDKEFFDGCFRQIPDFDRERAVMIGDSLSSDIRGGANAGIKTLWYNPRGKRPEGDIRPDYEAASLEDIPGILDEVLRSGAAARGEEDAFLL